MKIELTSRERRDIVLSLRYKAKIDLELSEKLSSDSYKHIAEIFKEDALRKQNLAARIESFGYKNDE